MRLRYQLAGSILGLAVLTLSACEKQDTDELRRNIPGGTLSIDVPAGNSPGYSVKNDTFASYGLSIRRSEATADEELYYFNFRASGEKDSNSYYIEATGQLDKYAYDMYKGYPKGKFFELDTCHVRLTLKNNDTTYLTTLGTNSKYYVQGKIEVSRFGNVGDSVTVRVTGYTFSLNGTPYMECTARTKYVIYQY